MLSEAVRRLRIERGWSQGQLAQRAGLTQGHISIIEKGEREKIRGDTAARLASAFSISLDEFMAEVYEGSPPEAFQEQLSIEEDLLRQIDLELQGLSLPNLRLIVLIATQLRTANGLGPIGGNTFEIVETDREPVVTVS